MRIFDACSVHLACPSSVRSIHIILIKSYAFCSTATQLLRASVLPGNWPVQAPSTSKIGGVKIRRPTDMQSERSRRSLNFCSHSDALFWSPCSRQKLTADAKYIVAVPQPTQTSCCVLEPAYSSESIGIGLSDTSRNPLFSITKKCFLGALSSSRRPLVILPVLTGFSGRTHAAIFSF